MAQLQEQHRQSSMPRREKRSDRVEMALSFSRNRYLNSGMLHFIEERPCVHKLWQLSCFLSLAQYNRASRSSYIALFNFTEGSKKKPGDSAKCVPNQKKKPPKPPTVNYKVLNAKIRLGLLTQLLPCATVLYIGHQITHKTTLILSSFVGYRILLSQHLHT